MATEFGTTCCGELSCGACVDGGVVFDDGVVCALTCVCGVTGVVCWLVGVLCAVGVGPVGHDVKCALGWLYGTALGLCACVLLGPYCC